MAAGDTEISKKKQQVFSNNQLKIVLDLMEEKSTDPNPVLKCFVYNSFRG